MLKFCIKISYFNMNFNIFYSIERDNESEQLDHEIDCAKKAESVKDDGCTDARSIGFTSEDFEEDEEYEKD